MSRDHVSSYAFSLKSALLVDECRARLRHEFYGTGTSWRHAASERAFLGWQEGREFVIAPSTRFDIHYYSAPFDQSRRFNHSRLCRTTLRATADGTLIVGTYAYASGTLLLMIVVFGGLFGVILGATVVIIGFSLALRDGSGLWLAAFGAIWLLVVAAAIVVARIVGVRDNGFNAERDRIVGFLARVLEADVVRMSGRQETRREQR